jgi:RNA polymerase sigma-70 factor (ECF subfamily)
MLGSLAEAEDIIQDAWLRWSKAWSDEIREPRAFLRKVTTRLCLDHLKSARQKREEYVGQWLPEPLPEYATEQLGDQSVADDITMSLLLTLERLSPAERASFLLHDIFDVPFAEVSTIIGASEASCRQLASRGRKKVQSSRPRFKADAAAAAQLADAFLKAARDGDAAALRTILAQDVILYSDGGGKRPAALNKLEGQDKVSRFLLGLHRKRGGHFGALIYKGRINGAPGFVTLETDGLPEAVAVDVDGGAIIAIYIVRNPEKLRAIRTSAPADRADRSGSDLKPQSDE